MIIGDKVKLTVSVDSIKAEQIGEIIRLIERGRLESGKEDIVAVVKWENDGKISHIHTDWIKVISRYQNKQTFFSEIG